MKSLSVGMALALVLGCVGGAGKGMGQRINRTPLDPTTAARARQLVTEGDELWKERGDETKLRQALAKWEEAVKINTADHETYAKLARGTYLLADGYLSFDSGRVDEFLATHERGKRFAEQGLMALSPDFENRRFSGVKLQDAVMVLDRAAVPLLYWYDVNLGKWAKFKGISTTLKYKDEIFGIMTKVAELDPDYFYAAPDRYFGGFYAVAPSFAGGDLAKSAEYFQSSVKKQPNYLATHVLIADLLAPKLQDRAMFERELKFVLDTPAESMPDVIHEQNIEKKKAEKLLKELDERF